jgi:hypothetical protein
MACGALGGLLPMWGTFGAHLGSMFVFEAGLVFILAIGCLFWALGGGLRFPRGPSGFPEGSMW